MPLNNDTIIEMRPQDPIMLIDEASSTDYFIGISDRFKDAAKPYWRIKRIWKIGNVWHFGFPNGQQDYKFIWDDRYGYTYLP